MCQKVVQALKLKLQKGSHRRELTPEGCKEMENADVGAHSICEMISPFIFNRVSNDSAPTARI